MPSTIKEASLKLDFLVVGGGESFVSHPVWNQYLVGSAGLLWRQLLICSDRSYKKGDRRSILQTRPRTCLRRGSFWIVTNAHLDSILQVSLASQLRMHYARLVTGYAS